MIGLELEIDRDVMETPRTDKATFVASLPGIDIKVVDAGFARQLETELADKEKQLAEARAEIARKEGGNINEKR